MAGLDPTRFTHLKIARLFSWLQAYVFEVVSCRLPRPILPMARSLTRIRLCGRPAATFASGCGTRCVHLVGLDPAIRSGTSLRQMGDCVTGRDEWVATNESWYKCLVLPTRIPMRNFRF